VEKTCFAPGPAIVNFTDPTSGLTRYHLTVSEPARHNALAAFRWALALIRSPAVNVRGVIHGLKVFVPRMIRNGSGGHVINTASVGGLQINPLIRNSSYSAGKYSVIGLSEALAAELEEVGIGISVLCPGFVDTTINRSFTRRRQRLRGQAADPATVLPENRKAPGLSPEWVGERALDAVAAKEFFIFTDEEARSRIVDRHHRIMSGFDSIRRYNKPRPDD
jgi:NAD(P)-dependent dehydrogenase (short-subunit alcohol dehydrogenase family)